MEAVVNRYQSMNLNFFKILFECRRERPRISIYTAISKEPVGGIEKRELKRRRYGQARLSRY